MPPAVLTHLAPTSLSPTRHAAAALRHRALLVPALLRSATSPPPPSCASPPFAPPLTRNRSASCVGARRQSEHDRGDTVELRDLRKAWKGSSTNAQRRRPRRYPRRRWREARVRTSCSVVVQASSMLCPVGGVRSRRSVASAASVRGRSGELTPRGQCGVRARPTRGAAWRVADRRGHRARRAGGYRVHSMRRAGEAVAEGCTASGGRRGHGCGERAPPSWRAARRTYAAGVEEREEPGAAMAGDGSQTSYASVVIPRAGACPR
jgi:hypothetical protein